MMKDTPAYKNLHRDFRLQWLKQFLLRYFEERDGRVFNRMLKRHENQASIYIMEFFESPVVNIFDWQKLILIFYKTEYEKFFYKWVYVTKKISRPIIRPPSPSAESPPPTPSKKSKNKPTSKGRKGKERKGNGKDDLKSSDDQHSETDNPGTDEEKSKRRKSGESKARPESPQTAMEMGPQAESELITQKVKTLVKKKKRVSQLHCHVGPVSKKLQSSKFRVLFICRKSINEIPEFDTYAEAVAELPKYIFVGTLNIPEYTTCFRKQLKVLINHLDSSLTEPEFANDVFLHTFGAKSKRLYKFKNLALPYDAFFVSASNFYHNYQRISRKLYSECGTPKDISFNILKTRLSKKEPIPKRYTLKTIISSPLYLLREDLANIFYNIRQIKQLKEMGEIEGPHGQAPAAPMKSNLVNHLYGLIKKVNWCLNHIESDINIELSPWPGIDEMISLSADELQTRKEVLSKMEKKLEIWEKYVKTLLNRCRSKDPKGCGPVAEYQYWFKREDQLGPLVLTLYGKNVTNILNVLKKVDSPEVKLFVEKRLSLKRYYEISRDNRDYISACIQCLEGINTAKYMDEVRRIIPEFWENLRYLWLLSGYWAVKSNIVGFIERVQYLIVKKSIRVLEVNHFFMVPQIIAKQLAVEVIHTMETWKSSFHQVKAYIETHQWEMRWEFPLHRIFTITDYMAKLAKDFSYLAESLKQYLDIFCYAFSQIVQDEFVIEGFSERVKSLTVPLKSADFNIYDPDNDVHWNLLIESFARDLNTIEKESLQIINQSFKNLRSSVYATNFLIMLKELKSEDKSYMLLMKKFEFVNIQVIKEIKLINEFIMNQILSPPILNYHTSYPGTIYWIRQLCTSVQFRYWYLSSIDEIKNTRTQYRAEECFIRFIKFYELYQLTAFIDWIYTRKQNIQSQLSGKIFKLKNVPSPFENESYENLWYRPRLAKIYKIKIKPFQLQDEDHDNDLNEKSSDKLKHGNNKRNKSTKTDDKELTKVLQKPSLNQNGELSAGEKVTSAPSRQGKEDFQHIEQNIVEQRRLLLFLLYHEKRTLQHSKRRKLLSKSFPEDQNKAEHSRHISSQEMGCIGTREDRSERVEAGEKDKVCTPSECPQENEANEVLVRKQSDFEPQIETRTSFSGLQNIQEIFSSQISSEYLFTGRHDVIVESIIKVADEILKSYSDVPSHFLDIKCGDPLAFLFLLPLFFSDTIRMRSVEPYSESSECTVCYSTDSEHTDNYIIKDYPALNKDTLFEISAHNVKRITESRFINNKALEDVSPYAVLQENSHISPVLAKKGTSPNQQSLGTTANFAETNEDASDFEVKSDVPWHEYISDYLLIEKGHLVSLNFDVKLFDLILEIYHMTKLGYKLPSQFYGLCLLNRTLLRDLQALRKITDQYNNLILKLTKESLLTLKVYLYEFEYLLLKGLNYYSWHTTKVDHFCIQLHTKMKKIICLENNTENISTYIDQNIAKIKWINWFNFSQISSNKCLNVKEFFEELEEVRDEAFRELSTIFNSISRLLKKLEYLVLNQYSGRSQYLVLYYKHYEEEIFKALVSNFLLNTRRFKNFIIGKSTHKMHLKLINNPNVEYDFNDEQCRYFLVKSLEKLLLRYKIIPRWKMGTCENVPSVKSNGLDKIYRHNYIEDMMKLKIVATELIDTRQIIDAVTHSVSSYLTRWEHYKILWDFDKEITTDNFVKFTKDVIGRSDVIFGYYDNFISELNYCKDSVEIYCFRVDLKNAVQEILRHALEWKNILKCKLIEQARNHSSKLHHRLSGIYNVLTNRVKNLEDFQNVLQSIKDFVELSSDYEILVSFISEIQYILARHGLRYSEDDRKTQKEIQHMYSVILKLSKYRAFQIKPSFKIYSNISEERIDTFTKECNLFAEHYYKVGPGTVGDKLDEGYILLEEFRMGFNGLNLKRESMIQAEHLFDHTPHSYKIFDEAFEEFCHLEIAYNLYQKQKDAQIEWAKIPWIYLNAAELMSGIDELLVEFENLPVAVKSLPVAHEVWICMNNFKDSIPLMVELKNESLKDRHWKELMLKTGHEFEMIASKFTLNDMFCMKLHQHKGTVNDIIGKAVKELGVEKSINFVNQFWDSQRLTCTSRSKQIILDDTYGTLILLDDYCINLQRMADSQFALPFVPEIKEWEKKLSNIREIITEVTTLQGSLINLKTIFDDRKLQKTLPEAHKLFEFIDKEFTKLIKSIQFKKNILQQTLVPGQLENIKGLIQNVEHCKHVLSNYLASKRNQFPRFFLLEDEEVFSIMGSKGPDKIQVFIPKIFCNLKGMLLKERKSKKDTIEVNGMISCEDESLNFKNPVLLLETLPAWMLSVQEEMKCSTKYMSKMAIYSYAAPNQTRTEWIYQHISSCVLAAIKVWWTLEVEDTLRKMKKGEMQAMKLYINVLNTHLHETFLEVNKSLKRVDRMKFRNVILADLHGRDVAEKLSNNSIISTNDFEWESQIRFYWKKQEDSLYISQTLEEFEYGYEYMGIGRRLVVTPLTERIYLALTQAFSMKFGGALRGPVSTGKTETVKDLAKVFGIFCIFTNCSDTMTLESFKKIIAVLCQDGMWGCFDEFNLISESILTVIWKYMEDIRTSMVKNHTSVILDGSKIPLNSRIGLFITMNPGFVGSETLPHTMRLLFRSVACISPHTEQICEAVLFSEGFLHAKILARKMVKLYELAKTQLSNKTHYDFGLRSIKSLLLIAGDLKRNAPDMEEVVVLMRALRDSNRSKFVPGDDVIFNDLISDLFPGVDCPPKLHPELEKTILEALTGKDYIYIEKQAAKVVELYEVLNLRQSAMIVGPSGGGKTLIINTLCHVLSSLGTPTSAIKINPKAMPPSHLFGYFDNVTQNWIDGIFSKLFRNINNLVEPQTRRYILCDGDIDPLWTENINSVMDDNKQLTLANSERIPLAENCGLLFETGHVQNVSPGIISRTGVVYVNPKENGYRPYWDKWVKTRIDEDEVILLNSYFEKYVPDTLQLIFGKQNETGFSPPLSTVIPLTQLNMVVQLCFMIDALLPIVEKEVPQQLLTTKYICQKDRSKDDAETSNVKGSNTTSIKPRETLSTDQQMIQDESNYPVECIFIQALYTSLGAALSQNSQIVFDEFIKKKTGFNQFDDAGEKKATFGFLPTKLDTLFDYCADLKNGVWIPWCDLVEPYVHDRTKHFDEVIVPTKDSSRLVWIISMINKLNSEEFNYKSYKYKMKAKKKAKRPILLVGETSSSKTTTVQHFAEKLNPEKFVHCRMALSSQTSAATIQHFLVSFLEKYTTYTMRPKYGKKMIMFVDDINRPQADGYGTQETTAFLKLLIENSGIFHHENNFNWNTINDVYFYTTLSTTGRSSQQVDPRFLSLFSIFSTWAPKDDVISHIYSSVLQGHTAVFEASIKSICPAIISATIKIYKFAVEMLMPTPKKFHYSFNLRDMSRIIEGLLQTSPPYYTSTHQFIRVWRNEVTRVLCDRLSSQEDEILLQNKIKETISEYFVDSIDFVMREPLLFGDYRNAMQPGLRRDYEDLLDYEAVYHLFTEILDEIRKTTPQVSLLLFEDALEHLTRIHRVLRIYRGHALVVGPAGSGKQTVVNLASYTAGCKVFSIKLRRGYDESMFRNDVRELYKETGLQRQPTTFLLKAHQIIDDSFLEIINTVLITGSFMSVFTDEEKNAFLKECSFAAENHDGIETNMFLDWEKIETNSKENLHIVILMPHCDEVLRKRCYKYPGLLNNTIIDWMQPWPSEALYAIARRQLKDAENIPDMYKEAIVEVMVVVYENTSKFSYEINDSKQSFITPRHYLDVLEIYITMVGGNLAENHTKCEYLEKAIAKLTEATKHMEELRRKIVQQKLSVDEKKNVCESLSTDIFEASDILEMKRKEATEKSQEIDDITLELNQQMNEIQAVLTRAMEDIEKAQDSIRYMDLEEINKISAQDVPSEMAAVVFECILILLGSSVINWQETKAMLDDPLFLSNLEEINLNSISIQQQKQIRSRLKRLGKIKDKDETESADVAFLMLVEAILNYCAAFRETKPKQERISELEKSLNKAQNYMNNLNVVIGETEKQLEVLNEKQVKAVSESENEEADLQVTFQKLEAADKLIKGLEGDNIKWDEELQTLKKGLSKVAGNRLICAFFLAYSGTFTWEQRTMISSMWIEKTRTKRIPISKPFNLEEQLTTDLLLSKWKKDFLPNNEWSLQNAILITFSPRYPFCLDPKEQAVKWIIKCESKNNLIVLTFEDPEFQEQLKMSIKIKKPILIRDVDYLDPVRADVLEKPIEGELAYNTENVYEATSCENETIRLYMTTKSQSLKFDPSIFSQTTVINFEISPKEVEETLLNIIIENEQNNLWKQCEEVKKADYFSRCEQSNLNKSLLEKVGAPEHCVLESTQRIEELHFIKLEIYEVQSKLEKNELFLREFESQISIYNTIAKCGTVLYFVIKNLDLINSLYQCSLNLYTEEFKRSLKKYENHPITKTHVEDFELHLKRYCCRFGCRGVFSAHKQLVPFLMTIELEKLNGNLNQREIDFFISGSKEITDSELPPFHWLTKKGWKDMKKLGQDFPETFGNIVELLTKHGADWEKWYSSQKMDKWNFPSSMSHLMSFQKLLLLRCLFIEQLPQALNHYISETMGEEFINLPYQSINEAFEECTPNIPIIVLYEPGFEPLEKIKKLASRSGISALSFMVIVLEKHEEETNDFQDQIHSGEWVIYYNWDSNKCLLKKIEDLLKCEYETHPNFQLWLIAETNATLPIHILQSSIRVILDTPSPIKFKLRNIYEDMEENFLESCSHPSFKPLVYVTSFFHSVVQERKKFVKVGWNMDYDFGHQDFLVAISVLKAHLSNAVNSKYDFIPWQCLTFLIGEIIYSGYILDKYDRKIILTYLEEYFDDFLFSGDESFAFHKDFEGKYRLLPDGNKEDYIAEIDRLPLVTTSSVLGLHLNNQKLYNENSMEQIWTLIGLVQGSSGGKSECNEEDVVIDIIERIVDIIPSEFNTQKIQISHREKKFTSPITSVLLHELEGFNSLIKKMNTSVTDLKNAVKGKIKMEEEFHLIFKELLNGKLPVEWRKLSPPTCSSLGTWLEYTVERAEQYGKWCAQGQLPVIWLGGFQSPKSYLMSLLQAATKKKGWSLENLLLKTEITQTMDIESIQETPGVGCYISKVFLQGAGWDMNKQCLKPLEPNGLLTKLPILWVTPNETFSLLVKENLKIPVHQSFLRNHNMDSLVFEADLNSSVPTTCWILEGVCMLLNKD